MNNKILSVLIAFVALSTFAFSQAKIQDFVNPELTLPENAVFGDYGESVHNVASRMVELGYVPTDTMIHVTSDSAFIINYASEYVLYAPSLIFTRAGLYSGYVITRQTNKEGLSGALSFVHKANMVIDVFYQQRESDEEFGKVYVGEHEIGNTVIARAKFNYDNYRFTFIKAIVREDGNE